MYVKHVGNWNADCCDMFDRFYSVNISRTGNKPILVSSRWEMLLLPVFGQNEPVLEMK